MKSFITSIGTAVPEYGFEQMRIAEFMAAGSGLSGAEKRKLLALYKASGIEKRFSVIPDFGSEKDDFQFFPKTKNLEPFPSVSERMKLYEEKALPLSLQAIQKCLRNSSCKKEQITHLITVSCTGMYAPGLDIEITQALQLNKTIWRTCINFMGCYAAFNALKTADTICRAYPGSKVLIVCTELCTIHYQKKKDWDQILSNALFGDGAAAVLVEGEHHEGPALSLETFHCDMEFSGRQDMAWNISDFGFEMILSSYVPDLIQQGIHKLSGNALIAAGLEAEAIDYYAIHPGGKKIIEVIERELTIDKSKTIHSHNVLKNYGNMSSPTILFVMENIMNEISETNKNKTVLGFAFGPGLTMESLIMRSSFKAQIRQVSSSQEEINAL